MGPTRPRKRPPHRASGIAPNPGRKKGAQAVSDSLYFGGPASGNPARGAEFATRKRQKPG